MDRAEAIKQLEWIRMLSVTTDKKEAYGMAIAALREQEQSKWISVEERLPECGKDVLVMRSNSVGNMAVWRLFCPVSNGQSYWEDEIGDGLRLTAATHWMPLPEPPKEGADHAD